MLRSKLRRASITAWKAPMTTPLEKARQDPESMKALIPAFTGNEAT